MTSGQVSRCWRWGRLRRAAGTRGMPSRPRPQTSALSRNLRARTPRARLPIGWDGAGRDVRARPTALRPRPLGGGLAVWSGAAETGLSVSVSCRSAPRQAAWGSAGEARTAGARYLCLWSSLSGGAAATWTCGLANPAGEAASRVRGPGGRSRGGPSCQGGPGRGGAGGVGAKARAGSLGRALPAGERRPGVRCAKPVAGTHSTFIVHCRASARLHGA